MFDGTSAQHFCCDMLSRPDFVSLAHRQLGQLVGQKPSQTQRTTLFHVSKRPSPRYINIPSAGFLFTSVYICLHTARPQFQLQAPSSYFQFQVLESLLQGHTESITVSLRDRGEDRMRRWALHPVLVSNCPMAERVLGCAGKGNHCCDLGVSEYSVPHCTQWFC